MHLTTSVVLSVYCMRIREVINLVIMRCKDAIADALSKERVKYVSGLLGGHNSTTLYDALNVEQVLAEWNFA